MAETANRRRQPSRLQRRAPASIQINRSTDWNVAIPLLSPLASSPPSIINPTAEIGSRLELPAPQTASSRPEPPKPVVYKNWQHPAAPFCYEPSPNSFAPYR
uniref:Uncharacterized protein n=1 Tax=Opuntia streptacantha TaxID=393608 RepID=A0A7C8YUM9_OPUST